jgi:hypothetical protein
MVRHDCDPSRSGLHRAPPCTGELGSSTNTPKGAWEMFGKLAGLLGIAALGTHRLSAGADGLGLCPGLGAAVCRFTSRGICYRMRGSSLP